MSCSLFKAFREWGRAPRTGQPTWTRGENKKEREGPSPQTPRAPFLLAIQCSRFHRGQTSRAVFRFISGDFIHSYKYTHEQGHV